MTTDEQCEKALAFLDRLMSSAELHDQLSKAQKELAEKTARLTKAEALLADDLQWEWCENCDDYTGTDYRTTVHRSASQQEEGVYICGRCESGREHQ